MREIQFVGISDGLVNSPKCGFCEHCMDLPKGQAYFNDGGVSWCESCILSSDFSPQEIKIVKKDKKWHFLPDNDNHLMTVPFEKHEIKIYQTYNLINKASVPGLIKLSLYSKQQLIHSETCTTNDVVAIFCAFVAEFDLKLDRSAFMQYHNDRSEEIEAIPELAELFDLISLEADKDTKKKQVEKNDREQYESFLSGKDKITNTKSLHDFIQFHFKEIHHLWPSFVREEIKDWDMFKINSNSVTVDLSRHSLMWGTYTEDGSVDADFRADYGRDYQWDEEIYYMEDLFKEDKNENLAEQFFNKIGIELSLVDKTLIFRIKDN